MSLNQGEPTSGTKGDTMKSYYVYVHTSPNGKRYVGQTCQNPEHRWNRGLNYLDNPYFMNAINKYGWDSFSHEVVAENLTYEEADVLECLLINKYNCCNPEYGYNIQLGGHNGQVHSDETKQKISAKMKEIYNGTFTEEHRQKISESKKGKCSDNSRENALKNIENMRGKPLSEEHKQNISEAKKGRPGRAWTEEDRLKHSERMKQVYGAKAL